MTFSLFRVEHFKYRMNLLHIHPVLKIFYSNHLVSTVSTNITFNALYALIFVSTVSTNIAFNALYALIFVSTVSTNKIPYTIHNSIALIFCIDFLDMPFNIHTTDKVTMGVNEWLPHYLIQSRSHCNSNFKFNRVLIQRNNPK